MNKNSMIALAGVLLGIISCWLGWMSFAGESASGMDGNAWGMGAKPGVINIILGVLAGVFIFLNKKWSWIAGTLCSLLMVVFIFFKYNQQKSALGDLGDLSDALGGDSAMPSISLGIGFYVCLVGFLAVVAGMVMMMKDGGKSAA